MDPSHLPVWSGGISSVIQQYGGIYRNPSPSSLSLLSWVVNQHGRPGLHSGAFLLHIHPHSEGCYVGVPAARRAQEVMGRYSVCNTSSY